jgi:hypothetical protein
MFSKRSRRTKARRRPTKQETMKIDDCGVQEIFMGAPSIAIIFYFNKSNTSICHVHALLTVAASAQHLIERQQKSPLIISASSLCYGRRSFRGDGWPAELTLARVCRIGAACAHAHANRAQKMRTAS